MFFGLRCLKLSLRDSIVRRARPRSPTALLLKSALSRSPPHLVYWLFDGRKTLHQRSSMISNSIGSATRQSFEGPAGSIALRQ